MDHSDMDHSGTGLQDKDFQGTDCPGTGFPVAEDEVGDLVLIRHHHDRRQGYRDRVQQFHRHHLVAPEQDRPVQPN